MTYLFSLQRGLFSEPPPLGSPWRGVVLGAAASLLALTGCDGSVSPAESSPASTEAPLVSPQGMSLQGMSLQGMSLQGMSLQGMSLQGMSLQGMSLQGMSLQGMSLQGTSFRGTDLNGNPVSLSAGSVLRTTDSSGAPVSLRVGRIQQDWQDGSGEVKLYAIEGWNASAGQWQNVCNPDPWGEQWAIPVSGSWNSTGAHVDDANAFTFGCTSGVIAKCVRWGYRPWKSVNGVSLAPYHQACTRMARADYCGDGVSHTRNGTLIDMYDTLGIQSRTPETSMFFEGAWTPDGAYCIGKERWQGLLNDTSSAAIAKSNSSCYKKLAALTAEDLNDGDVCAAKLSAGTKKDVLLRNRSFVNILTGP
jgi:hypothetical protein